MENAIHDTGSVALFVGPKAMVTTVEGMPVKSAAPLVKKVESDLNIAEWGEDNRFPQNIEKEVAKCSVARTGLEFKSKSLWGAGLVYGEVIGFDDKGNELFKQAKPGDFPEIDEFFDDNNIPLFFAELNLGYAYYYNSFPEIILSKDGSKITNIVSQEPCDCRFKQRDAKGNIDTVVISKLWGIPEDQFVKFDTSATELRQTLYAGNREKLKVDNKFFIRRKALNPRFPNQSFKKLVEDGARQVIFPICFPSNNKTYYQLAHWDAVRVVGWMEIATKVPQVIKALYENGFTLRYHIEIAKDYYKAVFGTSKWENFTEEQQSEKRKEVLDKMNEFLSGSDNAYKTFITHFDCHPVTKEKLEMVNIHVLDVKTNVDKDLLTSGTANSEILFALGVNPNILGAGKPGGVFSGNQGGSNIREGKTVHDALLDIDRKMQLKLFYLIKKFNKWPTKAQFRFKDTVLLTLDKGAGVESKTS